MWSEGYLLLVWGMVLLLSRSLLGPAQDVELRPCWVAGINADVAVLLVLVLSKTVKCSLCMGPHCSSSLW